MVKWFKIINLKVFSNNYINTIIDDCIKQRFIFECAPRMGAKSPLPVWAIEDFNLILKYRKDLIEC